MRNKRIIIIRNANYYDFGGGELFPVFTAASLNRNGFDATVVSRSPQLLNYASEHSINTIRGWWWSRQNWSGTRILLFPIYFIWQIVLYFWYLQLFIRINPIAVHIQGKDDFIAATLAGKTCKKQIIWTDHGDLKHIWMNHRIWYKNPVGKLVYLSALFADRIVVVSENEKRLILDNFRKRDAIERKLTLISNGSFDKFKSYKKTKSAKFTFLFAGRLVTDKGVGEIIEAFNKLSKTKNNIQLQIVGSGPEEEKFKGLALKNKDIHFLGYKSDPYPNMASSDVFLYPSYHEAFGIAVVDAAMLELPIIASEVGGIPEIITNNKSGLLVKPRDSESLYKAMNRLYTDRNLAKSLSTNARARFEENFNFEEIVKNQYIPLYEGKK